MALARTTLLSSVFISATVCRTVASNVASSITSTPAFACPRATRPSRPKKSPKNAIAVSPRFLSRPGLFDQPYALRLCGQVAQQAARAHYVHQQEMHAAQNVVLVVRSHALDLAKVVQGYRYVAAAGIVQLE